MSRAQVSSLDLVLEQALRHQESIAKKVQVATTFIEQERLQTQNLNHYLDEYQTKIRQQRQCTAVESMRYRSFCAQLETAIIQQEEKVVLAERRLAELRQELIQEQHKITVLKEMIEKKHVEVAAADEKQQQKLIDELSTRQYLNRQRP